MDHRTRCDELAIARLTLCLDDRAGNIFIDTCQCVAIIRFEVVISTASNIRHPLRLETLLTRSGCTAWCQCDNKDWYVRALDTLGNLLCLPDWPSGHNHEVRVVVLTHH